MQGPQLTHVDRAMSDNMQSLQHVSSCLAQVQGAMANGNGSAALAAEVRVTLALMIQSTVCPALDLCATNATPYKDAALGLDASCYVNLLCYF
jgi:hypothetical protein